MRSRKLRGWRTKPREFYRLWLNPMPWTLREEIERSWLRFVEARRRRAKERDYQAWERARQETIDRMHAAYLRDEALREIAAAARGEKFQPQPPRYPMPPEGPPPSTWSK